MVQIAAVLIAAVLLADVVLDVLDNIALDRKRLRNDNTRRRR